MHRHLQSQIISLSVAAEIICLHIILGKKKNKQNKKTREYLCHAQRSCLTPDCKMGINHFKVGVSELPALNVFSYNCGCRFGAYNTQSCSVILFWIYSARFISAEAKLKTNQIRLRLHVKWGRISNTSGIHKQPEKIKTKPARCLLFLINLCTQHLPHIFLFMLLFHFTFASFLQMSLFSV